MLMISIWIILTNSEKSPTLQIIENYLGINRIELLGDLKNVKLNLVIQLDIIILSIMVAHWEILEHFTPA